MPAKGSYTCTPMQLPKLFSRKQRVASAVRFLLQGLDQSPLRFRVSQLPGDDTHLSAAEAEVVSYVREHSGATINDIASQVPALRAKTYAGVRSLVASLANRHILKPCGQAPLEQVDGRYERVAACEVCGSPSGEHKTVLWKYNTPVVRCGACGLHYANPRWKTEHLFSRYTADYWEEYAGTISHTSVDETANNARWFPFLGPHDDVRSTNRLLDVGCATGEFLLAARARGWQVYGVESSPIGAATAARVTRGEVHSGTLDTANYPNGYFDVVTMWDVIEHLQSPRRYLQRIAEILRPGGLLSITTPNIRSLSFWLLGVDWTEIGPNDHLYYFTPRTMARLLDECGFSVYKMHTMAVEPVVWRQWLKYEPLHPFAPLLRNISLPITNRLLLGDELYLIAQRRSDT